MARNLADTCSEVTTIADVVRVLSAVRDASAEDIVRPEVDCISCFSRLYTIITQNVLDTVEGRKPKREFVQGPGVPDPARPRVREAVRRRDQGLRGRPWGHPEGLGRAVRAPSRSGIGHVNFAAAGVNAHVNFDLAFALLETWRTYPPNEDRRSDHDQVNEIFAEEMDELREDFEASLAEVAPDGSAVDGFGRAASDLLVRDMRGLAWEAAEEVWEHYDGNRAVGGAAYRKAIGSTIKSLQVTGNKPSGTLTALLQRHKLDNSEGSQPIITADAVDKAFTPPPPPSPSELAVVAATTAITSPSD